ncbi:MAG TPA: ABC transporter substrate-binding protein, partial [Bacillota bacterium]|nr:ABC transporter substrate-binding protein [Bacillota bacterium]
MMKKKWLASLTVLSCLFLSACGASKPADAPKDASAKPAADKKFKVGITQIIEHPSLDASRQGFIAALKDNGFVDGQNIEIDYQSAQGDANTVNTISQKFVNDKKDLILAIATPSAQSLVKATSGTNIPVLFTAITDPLGAKLVDNLEKPGKNVTGYSDTHPEAIKKSITTIKEMFPNTKKVGVIYNSGEANSVVNVNNAKKAMAEIGLDPVEVNASNATEVKQAAESLIGRVDVLYVPKDNTVVAAIKAVVKVAEENHVPLFVGEMDSVKAGGFAGFGADYFELGRSTGEMAVKILKGEAKAGDIPVQFPKEIHLAINKEAA